MKYTLLIPPDLSLGNSIKFCNDMLSVDVSNGIVFDFKWMRYIDPFSLVYVSSQIEKFTSLRPEVEFNVVNYHNKSYAGHMGFFQAFGVDFGNAPGAASGSSSYIPITVVKVDNIKERSDRENKKIGDIVESDAHDFAVMLVRNGDEELIETLTYSLREVIRNVVEHSESKIIKFCAQFWPTKGKVELIILDEGIGIKESLSNNPFLQLDSDREAIQLSLMPGVSGKMFKGVRKIRTYAN